MIFPKKILVISPAWIGDIVMAQALLKFIKHQYFQANIDILAPSWSHGLLSMMPEINEILDMPLGHTQLQLRRRWQLGKQLRKKGYQQAIILPNSWKSALIPFAARIPVRTGWLGEMRFGLLNDWRILHKKELPLMVQRFLALGTTRPTNDRLSIPSVKPTAWQAYMPMLTADLPSSQNHLGEISKTIENNKPFLTLSPGAAFGSAKRWPVEYFAEIAKIKQTEGWEICLLGSPSDQAIAQRIQKLTGDVCIDLTGKTSLSQAIAILSKTTLLISNDSGLMHITAALQRPLIALYGSSSPQFTPPLSNNTCTRLLYLSLPCSPCFQRECPLVHLNCLNQIKPSMVLTAIDELIAKNHSARPVASTTNKHEG